MSYKLFKGKDFLYAFVKRIPIKEAIDFNLENNGNFKRIKPQNTTFNRLSNYLYDFPEGVIVKNGVGDLLIDCCWVPYYSKFPLSDSGFFG